MVLTLVMLLSMLPAIGSPVAAATETQDNIVARADYLYDITWTAQSTVYGWNYETTFNAGTTYRIPYGQPIHAGAYIGYGITVEDFLNAASIDSSVFYTSRSTYNENSSVYYATDSAGFVSWCWGIDRNTVPSLLQVATTIGNCSASNLQLGDALISVDDDHVILITGLTYNGDTLIQIEITEQAPPQMKRSYFTPTELESKYSAYSILRYDGSVSDLPGSDSGEDTPSTNTGNGYDRGYTGGMAGTGEYKAFGLDVSSWQGSSLDFNRIKNAGYDYVILRAGTSNGKDTCFETFYTNAKAAGLDIGAYYYSYATTVAAVKEDMNDFLSYIEGKKFEYPIYFDYEDPTQQALSSSLSQQICLTALDMLAAEGYLPGLYTGKYFSTQIPIDTICAKYEIWIAHYLSSGVSGYDGTNDYTKYGPTYASLYGMYQFTDSVWISGYGPYDGDVCYKDYPAIVKEYGFNGYDSNLTGDYITDYCTYYPAHGYAEVTDPIEMRDQPYSGGNKTEATAQGDVFTVTGMFCNGSSNMWYRLISHTGNIGYMFSGRVKYLGNSNADINISNCVTPSVLKQGSDYQLTGTVTSEYNALTKVSAYVYPGTDTPSIVGSANVTGNKYILDNSTLDQALAFHQLTPGSYTYVITAEYTSYYASTTKEATPITETIELVSCEFTVEESEANYVAQCTFYPSHCVFKITQDAGIFDEPRTQESVKLEDAPAGATYSSTGLYVTPDGEIFYQVRISGGQYGYIYAGHTQYSKPLYSDIVLSGGTLPSGHVQGTPFSVSGTISATYNTLLEATVSVCAGFVAPGGTAVTGGTDTVSNNKYVLGGSTIDSATAFQDLAAGNYTYLIQVTSESYYAKSAQELGKNNGTHTLKLHYFTVIPADADPNTCSHSNTTTIIEPATCVQEGSAVTACSICGTTVINTILKNAHTYGEYTTTVQPSCTEIGIKERTCTVCGKVYTKQIDATGHRFLEGSCLTCGEKDPDYVEVTLPTIALVTPTLLLEDTIKLNIYFTVDQDIDLDKMGMITWTSKPSVVDISTADAVYPGATFNSGNGYYGVNTDGIPAQNLGDIIYFCIYAEMEDGTIVYGKQVQYSPSTYAYNQLKSSSATPEAKALFVAILNYGAAAQNYLGYNTDALVNANLTDDMKALVQAYSSSMVDSIDPADSSKVGPYAATGGFDKKYPTVLLDGAFAINYHFTPSYTPDAGITLFYWTEADYNAATSLSPTNATGRITMTGSDEFEGIVEGIAAKDLGDTIYVVAGYRSDDVSYCTGVLPYSIGAFCVSQAGSGDALMKPLAQSIAVYGYYASAYFAQ